MRRAHAVGDPFGMTNISGTQATDGVPTYLERGDPGGRFADYYPAWMDKLASDVTLEGSLLDGAVQGADAVRAVIGVVRQLYDRQDGAANGIDCAYRQVGEGTPALVLLQHFRGNLDNWDPALVDALARDRRVVTFDDAGVGGSTGTTPSTITQIAVRTAISSRLMAISRRPRWGDARPGYAARRKRRSASRITSEGVVPSDCARSRSCCRSSGSSRTDSTLAGEEPSAGRPRLGRRAIS